MLDSNRILRSAYESELEIPNAGRTLWATFVTQLFKSIAKQDRNVYSIRHCDRFIYLMNNANIEIIKAVMIFFYLKCLQE